MARLKRPSADQTRENILNAAQKQFLELGFIGASIQKIAKSAGVNTNLIFHHFKNKETLWLKVKDRILSQFNEEPDYDFSSAKAYFSSVLDYRFKLYENNPDFVRFIQWQLLTDESGALIGNDPTSPNHWFKHIEDFQKKGLIRSDIKPMQIVLFIIFSSYATSMQKIIAMTKEEKSQYKKMILDMCCHQFLTHGENRE